MNESLFYTYQKQVKGNASLVEEGKLIKDEKKGHIKTILKFLIIFKVKLFQNFLFIKLNPNSELRVCKSIELYIVAQCI